MTVGLLSFGAAPSGFNGGLTQVGLGAPGYQGDFAYLNVLKMFQGFYNTINTGTLVEPQEMNADGYPTVNRDGGNYGVGYIPTQAERPGDYKVTWTGTGTIYAPDRTSLTGSTSTSGFTFTPSTNKIRMGIVSGTSLSNWQCFHVDDEPDVLAGRKFGNKFKQKMIALKMGRVRFMDWQSGNFGACAQWKYRASPTHICPAFFDHRPDLYAGVTTNSGDAFSVSFVDPYYGTAAPVHGQTFMVKWSALATTNTPTLTINGNGPYTILRPDGGQIFTGVFSTGRPSLNNIHTLIYDANFGALLNFGAGSANAYIDNGMPYEDMIDLCSEVRAHPHFVTPTPTAADGPTDFMGQLATLCTTRGPSWFKPAFETCNEIFTTSFRATQYSRTLNNSRNLAGTTYTNTGVTWTGSGPSVNADLTFSGAVPILGQHLTLGTYTGTVGYGGQIVYVVAVNVGGNPQVVTVNRAPNGTTGNPWSGSTTVTAATESGASHDWVGRTASMLGQQISAVYGDDRTKYDVLVGVQTGLGGSTAGSAARIDSTAYVIQGGSAAYNWVTSGTCAQYVGTGTYADNPEMIAAYRWYFTASSTVLSDYLDHLGDSSGSTPDGFPLPVINTFTAGWKSFFSASPRNIKKLCGYEGGYSNSLYDTSFADITSPVTGISNASQAVMTMATTVWPSGTRTGPAVDSNCAGAMLALSGLAAGPTAANCAAGSCTFTNSSAVITRVNTYIAGQMAMFTTTGVLPTGTGFTRKVFLYIVNPTGSNFQVATTKGGTPIVFNTAGQSGTHTVTTGWAVVSVSGNLVTIDLDTSNTTTYPTYVSGGTMTYTNSRAIVNKLRADAKQVVSSTTYPASGMKGWTKQIRTDFFGNSGGGFTCEYPSQYLFSAGVSRYDGTGDYGDNQIWGALNETVWTSLPCPMYQGDLEINAGI